MSVSAATKSPGAVDSATYDAEVLELHVVLDVRSECVARHGLDQTRARRVGSEAGVAGHATQQSERVMQLCRECDAQMESLMRMHWTKRTRVGACAPRAGTTSQCAGGTAGAQRARGARGRTDAGAVAPVR